MRLIGLEIPRNQTKALRLRSSVDHTVSQQQEKSPRLHREKCVFACPREALRSRPRPRIRPGGVMEYWSVGVLGQLGIAPRVRAAECFRAHRIKTSVLFCGLRNN